jgi:hypothetical protein
VKFRLAACLFLILPLPALGAGSHSRRAKQTAAADSTYVFALAAANRFLHAWQMGDLETGTVLLSDHTRHSHNLEEFERLFSGDAERAFEISRGKGNRGRYGFPVVLITRQGSGVHRKFSEIILVNTGKNDWAVDKLP